MPRPHFTQEEATAAFWSKVEKTDGCWLWHGAHQSNGYGSVTFRGRRTSAHRQAWELANGASVPTGMCVMHSCDNRSCCRPSHLSVGTTHDNVTDCLSKGRFNQTALARGEEQGLHKLTKVQVLDIRRRSADGERSRVLASEHGVSKATVNRIVARQAWAWLLADGSEQSREHTLAAAQRAGQTKTTT